MVQKIVAFGRATQINQVLLLFNGHFTHIKNLHIFDYPKDNDVVLLCFLGTYFLVLNSFNP